MACSVIALHVLSVTVLSMAAMATMTYSTETVNTNAAILILLVPLIDHPSCHNVWLVAHVSLVSRLQFVSCQAVQTGYVLHALPFHVYCSSQGFLFDVKLQKDTAGTLEMRQHMQIGPDLILDLPSDWSGQLASILLVIL